MAKIIINNKKKNLRASAYSFEIKNLVLSISRFLWDQSTPQSQNEIRNKIKVLIKLCIMHLDPKNLKLSS